MSSVLRDAEADESLERIQSSFCINIEWLLEKAKHSDADPKECIPIGIVSNELTECINAKCKIVLLSVATLRKLLNKHSDIMSNGIFCHTSIQRLIDYGLVVKEGRNNYVRVLLFLGQLTDNNSVTRWYKLAIKTTMAGHKMYLTSFHPINPNLKRNICNQGTIIRSIQRNEFKWKPISNVVSVLLIVVIAIVIIFVSKHV